MLHKTKTGSSVLLPSWPKKALTKFENFSLLLLITTNG